MPPARAPRADAVRNRNKILEAARDQITRCGPDAGMDEIAKAAGVAVGTLYRHFPTKADLVTAIIDEHMSHLADESEAARIRAASGTRALDEITAFLGRVVEASAVSHAAKAAAHALGAAASDKTSEHRATAALAELIQAGKAAGDILADVTVDDLYLLFASAPADQPPTVRARWLSLVLPGLTTHPRTLDTAYLADGKSNTSLGRRPA
ncbi:TetR/AcrR family transcriptional regulator [Nocardia pseudovaccinii]|uniref:TetR/AcrR family transcriptional regulator n=1 Tax=Nocardia pseudovaccinii TaxID=189540 RepID=UPI0007A4C256|nr:TetR/AcrR family transcriptional regulator [Nocardia pseudovaccinii]